MASTQESHDEYHVHAHVTSVKTYGAIFAALIVLTVLTVAASYVHLGPWNLIVAVIIATMKASLVVLYFMHMKYETKFNVIVFIGSVVFLGIFMAYTLNDTEYRGRVDAYSGSTVDPATGDWAHGTAPGLIQAANAEKLAAERAVNATGGEGTAVNRKDVEPDVAEPPAADDKADPAGATDEAAGADGSAGQQAAPAGGETEGAEASAGDASGGEGGSADAADAPAEGQGAAGAPAKAPASPANEAAGAATE
jgi:cytochrome c oxidase subunit 4